MKVTPLERMGDIAGTKIDALEGMEVERMERSQIGRPLGSRNEHHMTAFSIFA